MDLGWLMKVKGYRNLMDFTMGIFLYTLEIVHDDVNRMLRALLSHTIFLILSS